MSLSRQLRKDSPAALVQDDDDWDDFSDLDHPEYSSALMSFGSGRDGQLGVSEERVEYFPSPGFVNLGDSVPTAAAAGLFHSACITECGRMWLWGKNDGGRLGTGDEIARDLPTPMELPERATNMDCGGLFTAVVTGESSPQGTLCSCPYVHLLSLPLFTDAVCLLFLLLLFGCALCLSVCLLCTAERRIWCALHVRSWRLGGARTRRRAAAAGPPSCGGP